MRHNILTWVKECAKNLITKKERIETSLNAELSKMPTLGDIYLLRFDGTDQEQSGVRPALIISNNKGNQYSPNVIVLPLTTSLKKTNQPTHVILNAGEAGLQHDSMVLCENPVCVSKKRLIRYLTTIKPQQMEEVSAAYLLATGAISRITEEKLIEIRNRAVSLDATQVA